MAHHVFDTWGQPNLDLFATRYNKCPIFVSLTPDARALDTDALTIDWEGMFAYAFPPTIDSTSGPAEVPADTSVHSAAHSPLLAEAELVPRANE